MVYMVFRECNMFVVRRKIGAKLKLKLSPTKQNSLNRTFY